MVVRHAQVSHWVSEILNIDVIPEQFNSLPIAGERTSWRLLLNYANPNLRD
jgi:hypothetical protein